MEVSGNAFMYLRPFGLQEHIWIHIGQSNIVNMTDITTDSWARGCEVQAGLESRRAATYRDCPVLPRP